MSTNSDSSNGSGDSGGSGGGGGSAGGSGTFKFMNITESMAVGVPVRMAYDQWTQFADFPSFMKKVETVDQESDEKINWAAKVLWSKRSWESTIIEQVPDTHIVWRSTGTKGYADGHVSFHELAPRLTRILLVIEYHPQGFVEKTGNIWRAVGRRTRLEFKHFCRHLQMETLLTPDEDREGWRGEIRDSQVVQTHEQALEEEQAGEDHDAENLQDDTDDVDPQVADADTEDVDPDDAEIEDTDAEIEDTDAEIEDTDAEVADPGGKDVDAEDASQGEDSPRGSRAGSGRSKQSTGRWRRSRRPAPA